MEAHKTVTINGRVYDAVTGLPIANPVKSKTTPKSTPVLSPATVKKRAATSAQTVHASTQRSQTLHRRAAKKPGPAKRPKPGQHMDIARSSSIARFAKHPVATIKSETPDIAPKTHPTTARAFERVRLKNQPAPTPKQTKDAAITSALAKSSPKTHQKGFVWRWSKRSTIVIGSLIVLIIVAAVTYFNLPALSVGFASNQAGIEASYPEYQPDGFHLEQPVKFKDGEVSLSFRSNSNSTGYTITQSRSSWDSSAVLTNIVNKAVGENYTTTQERGLTIYSYDDTAVWVNGGILYMIVTTAPLSGEQIRHIAISL